MSFLDAIVMGVIQGLTEFLPVSSSGHLAMFKILFEVETETGMLFDVLLHLGTLLAVFAVFYKDIFHMIQEGFAIIFDFFRNAGIFFGNVFQKKDAPYYRLIDNSYRKFVMLVVVSTIPTGIIGYVAADVVEAASEILLVTGCLFSKFNRKFAVKYSFIMSIPAILGALVLKLSAASALSALEKSDISCYLAGTMCAAVVGYICIRMMLVVVKKRKFTFFAIYCLIVGLVSIGGYFYAA